MHIPNATINDLTAEKNSLAFEGNQRRHLLDLDDFSPEDLDLLFDTTHAMREILDREIKKAPTLRGKSVVTVFYEPSTRTRVSFEQAAKILSADVINLSVEASSITKGESLLETIQTLEALKADLVVLRHPHAGAPHLLAQHLQKVSIINAGDGSHAHPTQALSDLYTIRQRLDFSQGIKVVIIGDVAHSRVAKSNMQILSMMGARITLCGPPTLIPLELFQSKYPNQPNNVEIETNLDQALEKADVVMVLRLQHERQQSGLLPSLREYARLYQLNEERLKLAKPNALVLHPGPVNEGIEISPEVTHGTQSMVQQQITNGLAIRMALLYLMLTPYPQANLI